MRRAVVTVVALLAVLSTVPGHPAPAQVVEARAGQFAIADWLFIRGNRGRFYLAMAERGAGGGTWSGPPEADASVMLARGRCTVERSRHVTIISCMGRGIWRRIPLERFEVDPLLSSATVSVRARGFANRVEWVGRGSAPVPSSGAAFGPGYLEGGGGLVRGAAASARIFGDRVPRRGGRLSFAGLAEGAFAFADVFGGGEPAEDGTFRFTKTFTVAA